MEKNANNFGNDKEKRIPDFDANQEAASPIKEQVVSGVKNLKTKTEDTHKSSRSRYSGLSINSEYNFRRSVWNNQRYDDSKPTSSLAPLEFQLTNRMGNFERSKPAVINDAVENLAGSVSDSPTTSGKSNLTAESAPTKIKSQVKESPKQFTSSTIKTRKNSNSASSGSNFATTSSLMSAPPVACNPNRKIINIRGRIVEIEHFPKLKEEDSEDSDIEVLPYPDSPVKSDGRDSINIKQNNKNCLNVGRSLSVNHAADNKSSLNMDKCSSKINYHVQSNEKQFLNMNSFVEKIDGHSLNIDHLVQPETPKREVTSEESDFEIVPSPDRPIARDGKKSSNQIRPFHLDSKEQVEDDLPVQPDGRHTLTEEQMQLMYDGLYSSLD